MPAQTGTREAQLQLNPGLIQKEMERAQQWLEAHNTGPTSSAAGPRVTRVSFENSR